MERKSVVIIGGGFAGASCARQLQQHFDVTLIDDKEYFEYTPSIVRYVVEPSCAGRIRIPHSTYAPRVKFVLGKVSGITPQDVAVGDSPHPYDYLVIATGATFNLPFPGTIPASDGEQLRKSAEAVKAAKEILIIGGGFVGVELAAEIIEAYPEKSLRVLEMLPTLLPRSPPKAREYARKYLENWGVKIHCGEKLQKVEGDAERKQFITDRSSYAPDIAFLSTGIMPNYEHLSEHCSLSLNERNFLCVNGHLQVQNFSNIFAAGDLTALEEEKTAHNAERHAALIVRNIKHLQKSEPLETYLPRPAAMAISLGRKRGFMSYGNLVWRGRLPALAKRFIEWRTLRRYR